MSSLINFINWKPFDKNGYKYFMKNGEGPGPQPTIEPFYVQNIGTTHCEVFWDDPRNTGETLGDIECSFDGITWEKMELREAELLMPQQKLYIRASGVNVNEKQFPIFTCNIENTLALGGDISKIANREYALGYTFQFKTGTGRKAYLADISNLDFSNVKYYKDQFRYVVQNQNKLTTFPKLKIPKEVPKYAFYTAFGNTGITEVPSDLFEDLEVLQSQSLAGIFDGCQIEHLPDIPKCQDVSENAFYFAFYGNRAVKTHKTGSIVCSEQYYNDTNFEQIWLTSNTYQKLVSTDAFSGTKITSTSGIIHVPRHLLQQYRTGTNWSVFANRMEAYDL